jgi:dnd system-associated protein 4
METKKLKDPQIYVSKEAKELFENMKRRFDDFRSLENKDFFILAVLFGYAKGSRGRKKLSAADRTGSALTRERYLKDRDNVLLKAIAVAEQGDTEFLKRDNIADVYAIAEEYANGGIDELRRFMFDDPASFTKKFASLLRDHYGKCVLQEKQGE